MTVKELIELLKECDPDRLVILQKDSEGNGYSPLSGGERAAYIADSTWSGEVRYEPDQLTDEMRQRGYTEEDCAEEGNYTPAVVLWPVN